MASSSLSTSMTATISALLSHPVNEKLTQDNFQLWQAQVLPAVRSAHLISFLEGKAHVPAVSIELNDTNNDKTKKILVANPEHATWVTHDQLLLGTSTTPCPGKCSPTARCTTSAQVWVKVQGMFSSQSHSRIVHLSNKLATTRKGDMSYAAYFTKMTGFANDPVAAVKQLEDEDVISYILAGLDEEFNPFIENVCGRDDPLFLSAMYSQLLTAKARIEAQKAARRT